MNLLDTLAPTVLGILFANLIQRAQNGGIGFCIAGD